MKACPITNTIRRFRFDNDEMTQQMLADVTGVTRQTIAAIESGKYSPSLELAFRIASVFGVGIDNVFTYNSENDMELIRFIEKKRGKI